MDVNVAVDDDAVAASSVAALHLNEIFMQHIPSSTSHLASASSHHYYHEQHY